MGQVFVKGSAVCASSFAWLLQCTSELAGLLQCCSVISRPHSPPLAATLGSQLLITCARAASGVNPRGQTTEVTLSTLPLVISNPHASTDSCCMPPVNYNDHSPSAAATMRMRVGQPLANWWVRGQGSIECASWRVTAQPQGIRLLIVDGLPRAGPPGPLKLPRSCSPPSVEKGS